MKNGSLLTMRYKVVKPFQLKSKIGVREFREGMIVLLTSQQSRVFFEKGKIVHCQDSIDLQTYPPPYIKNNSLVIPSYCEPKYRYWQGGQSPLETVKQLTSDRTIWAKYMSPCVDYDKDCNIIN